MRKISARNLALLSAAIIGLSAAAPGAALAKDNGAKGGNGAANSGNNGNGNNGNSGNGNSGNGNSGNGNGGAAQGPSYALGDTVCALSDIGAPGPASACSGFYQNNLNGGSDAQDDGTIAALNALLGPGTYTDSFPMLEASGAFSSGTGGFTVNFGSMLYGDTIVSFHVGGANGQDGGVGYNATAFYRFDAGTSGLDTFTFNRPGLSNTRLYLTGAAPLPPPLQGNGGPLAVPEPAAWAMMIMGFGFAGALLRRRRAVAA